jgi:hypothetical protein
VSLGLKLISPLDSPALARFIQSRGNDVLTAFDRVVLPLIAEAVEDADYSSRLRLSLRGTSIKVGIAMSGYADMA